MTRTYKRVTERGADGIKYTREALEQAIDAVKGGGKTLRGTARDFKIPRSTLRHYVNGTRGLGQIGIVDDQNNKSFEGILLSFINQKPPEQENKNKTRQRICNGAEIITKQEYVEQLIKINEEKNKPKKTFEKKQSKGNASTSRKHKISEPSDIEFINQLSKPEEEGDKVDVGEGEEKNKPKKTPKEKVKSKGNASKTRKRKISESSDTASSFIDEISESEDGEVQILGVGEGDYIIVYYDNNYYPGAIIQKRHNKVKVKCMERAGKYGNWKWPDREDVLWYHEHNIKIIPPPTAVNNRGLYFVKNMENYY